MTNPVTEVMIEGRVVNGHPMTRRPVTKRDPITKVETPLLDPTGAPITELYFAVAIPKQGEQHWNQTLWGQQIHTRAVQDWPNGEHGALDFSWKIIDGDSQIPNKKGKKPADREGWAGNWILNCNTRFDVRCHHVGKYQAHEVIQDEKEINNACAPSLLGQVPNRSREYP